MTGRPNIFKSGALLAIDVDLVDRIWSGMSAAEALEGIRAGSLKPSVSADEAPGEPVAAKTEGLDVAMQAFVSNKHRDQPLTENLKAKRTLGIPWRWFTRIPDEGDEHRLDSRLLKMAGVGRLPNLTAADIMAVTSVVERRMVGGDEVREAFERWGTDTFRQAAASAADADVQSVLAEAWGTPEPLMAALEVEDPEELWKTAAELVRKVSALITFANDSSLTVVPRTKQSWKSLLARRSQARATAS